MKIMIKHDFESSDNQENTELRAWGLEITTIAEKMKLSKEETLKIIKKLLAYKMLKYTDINGHWTVYRVRVTDEGFVEFRDGWKKYVKEIMIALAASAPFVSLLIYFHQISN